MNNDDLAKSQDDDAPTLIQGAAHEIGLEDVFAHSEPEPAPNRSAEFIAAACSANALDDCRGHSGPFSVEPLGDPDPSRCGTQIQSPIYQARAVDLSASKLDLLKIHIPGYELAHELGRGGMGIVYKARDLKLNRLVALKTILGPACNDPRHVVRFMIEAEAVAAIRHPNVVQVFELGEVDGQPFMVMELVEGGSLAALLKAESKLNPRAAAALVAKVARSVEAAHASSIVHRDLKPQNILLAAPSHDCTDTAKFGEPKVTDFGIAKRGGGADLTQTNMVLGTPAYMSPEQAAGTKFVGPPSDVWSLGVILYECLAGVRPFPEDQCSGVIAGVMNHDPAPLVQAAPGVPVELDLICSKCLEKEAADRYNSAKELADDLDRYLNGQTVLAQRRRMSSRLYRWAWRNPVMSGLLLMVALCCIVLGASLALHYRQAIERADLLARLDEIRNEENQMLDNQLTLERMRREESDRLHREANAELVRANQVSSFLVNVFRTPDPLDFFGDSLLPQKWEHERKRTAEQLLKDAAERFRTELRDPALSLVRAKLLSSIGNSMKGLGLFKDAESALRESLELRYQSLPEDNPEVLRGELDLAQLLTERGDYLAGIERFRKVLAIQKRIGDDEAAILTTQLYEAVALTFFGDVAGGPILREVVAGRERLKGANHPDTLIAKLALAAYYLEFGQEKQLISLLPSIVHSLKDQTNGQFGPIAGMLVDCQTAIMMAHGADLIPNETLAGMERRIAEEKLLKSIRVGEVRLPPNHYLLSFMRFELAVVLEKLGKDAEAETLFKQVLADVRDTVSLAHPKVLVLVEHYTQRMARTNRTAEARKLYEETDQALAKLFGAESHWRCLLCLSRAQFEAQAREQSRSFASAIQAVEMAQNGKLSHTRTAASEVFHTVELLSTLKSNAEHQHIVSELFALNKQMVKTTFGASSMEMAILLTAEAQNRINRLDWPAALDLVNEAESLAAGLSEPLDPFRAARLLDARGEVDLARGQFELAERAFREASRKLASSNNPMSRAAVAEHLAGALVGQKRYDEAVSALDEARKFAAPRKPAESEPAALDRYRIEALAASGDLKRHAEAVQAMVKHYNRSTNLETLGHLAWAAGLRPSATRDHVSDLADRLGTALDKAPNSSSGHRALALVRLRMGDLAGAEAALGKGNRADPLEAVLRGLIAAALHDFSKAHHFLTSAETSREQWKPTAEHPFAPGAVGWHRHLEVDSLLAELRGELTPRTVAPLPRIR